MANPSIKWQQVAQGVEVHVGQIPPVIVGASSINAGLTLNDFRVYCCPRPQGSPGGGAGNAFVALEVYAAQTPTHDYILTLPANYRWHGTETVLVANPQRALKVGSTMGTLVRYAVK